MIRTIMYGFEPEGSVISRVGREIAFPVLDFDAIGGGGDGYKPGDFTGPLRYHLEKSAIGPYFRSENYTYADVMWTRGFGNTHGTPAIPLEVRNEHRKFWGFKPLKEET
jgi:hypothetical protein